MGDGVTVTLFAGALAFLWLLLPPGGGDGPHPA